MNNTAFALAMAQHYIETDSYDAAPTIIDALDMCLHFGYVTEDECRQAQAFVKGLLHPHHSFAAYAAANGILKKESMYGSIGYARKQRTMKKWLADVIATL